jgi:quercetin dioxygenase-like cupin family protein
MTMPIRPLAGAIALILATAACGGGGSAGPAATTAAAQAATAAPSPTRPVVPATAQGATSVKLTENKVAVTDGSAPDLAPGSYLSTVSLVTLEKGGRTVAHKHGGVESIYVLEGTVDFRAANGLRVLLTRGQGASVPPGTALQAINGGETTAKFLAFFMTPEAATFQTTVDTAP